jgi:glycosyltransferase involved in cell wall biosynthesis
MHILVATGIYPPEIGGPATYTVLLEKELPKYGYTVSALPFSVSRHLPKLFRHLDYALKLAKRARQADVIFAQDVASVGLPALIVAKLLRKVFLVRVPGDYAWEQSVQRYGVKDNIDDFQTRSYGLRVGTLRCIQSCVTRYADTVITPSDYFRELVSGWGVSKENCITIYNGVDLNVVAAPVEKPTRFTIVSAGRLVPWKGFLALIEILKTHPDWQLIILGDGPERERYQTLISIISKAE